MGATLMSDFFFGGVVGALVAMGIFLAVLVTVAIYIYFALAWRTIARKMKYKNDWLAWVPVANLAMILQLGGFHWALVFLILIPVIGWVALYILLIISTWKIFTLRNFPGWFSLSIIIPKIGGVLYLIALGFVAWQDKGGRKKPMKIKTHAKPKRKTKRR